MDGRNPIPAMLVEAVAAADAASLPEAVALIRPFLTDIGWFDAMMADQLRAMAADPMHLPALRASRQGGARHLVLARTERIWLAATVLDGRQQAVDGGAADRVHFSGRVSISRPLHGRLLGQRWRLDGERAVAAGVQMPGIGDVLELDERREMLSLRAADGAAMLIRAQIAPPGPVRARIYDARDGRMMADAQADEAHARTLMLLSLLRLQGRRDAVDRFAQALDAPLPGQRWAVMREYLALDTPHALPALRDMARREPDDAVRGLAMRTLMQIEGATQEELACPA